MALHINDTDTDNAVRKLAKLWGKSITETIKVSVEAQLQVARKSSGLAERTSGLRENLQALPDADVRSVKAIRAGWNDRL